MARSERRSGTRPAIKVGDCPCVADLIDYAERRAGADDRRRVEVHLQSTSCLHCRGWIARASASPSSAAPSLPDNPGHSPLVSNPIWLPQALADLEHRLQALND